MSGEVLNKNGSMGFTRMIFQKPLIAAIEGYCVAGGLEMPLASDIRIAGRDSRFGFLERRFGIPLIDGGTQRLPAIIGIGRALDMILTGKLISADEAYKIGLVNYITDNGMALEKAMEIGEIIDSYPQEALINDDVLDATIVFSLNNSDKSLKRAFFISCLSKTASIIILHSARSS